MRREQPNYVKESAEPPPLDCRSPLFIYERELEGSKHTKKFLTTDMASIFESNDFQQGERATESAHRKVELQSPAV